MTTILSVITMTTILWAMKSMNPVKVSMGVLIVSFVMFFFMGLKTGTVWFSMILVMLFMGGIIMMFMILSSVLPNEKSIKMKNILTIVLILGFLSSISGWNNMSEGVSFSSKSFLMESLDFFLMMTIILFYFLSSMSILSAEKTPMRSLTCHQPLIL